MKSKLPPMILAVFAIILTSLGWVLKPDHGPHRPAPEMAYIQLELHYQEAAEILQDHIQSDEMLAAGDIGVLGYYTRAYILDTLGLITPRASEYYPLPEGAYIGNYAIAANLITDYQPDYLVFPEVYGRRTLLQDPEFIESYDLLETIPSDIYGSKGIYIFMRQK
jgi:hypothetical protein